VAGAVLGIKDMVVDVSIDRIHDARQVPAEHLSFMTIAARLGLLR
jgi:hypothetical protein